MAGTEGAVNTRNISTTPGLKKIKPYWYPFCTMAKERWIGREILEVVSTEFRDRSMEFYRYALESGVTTINGKVARPDTIIRNGDRIENVVHRHEPPVTSTPVRVLLHDTERGFIVVNKPGSIPVHAAGRYNRNSLIHILMHEMGFKKVYTVNRLDRLTSGLMIIPLNADLARSLTKEFIEGSVRKEYVARVKGKFPDGEVICEEPLLTVDRQMGLNIVHPEGRPAKTVFNKIRYDPHTNSSVIHSHQLRVHLQYLGYPIANDPVYSSEKVWGRKLGEGGIDTTPSDERAAPAPPEHLKAFTESIGSPESLAGAPGGEKAHGPATFPDTMSAARAEEHAAASEGHPGAGAEAARKLLPRETGEDIGMGSPVPLSREAIAVITNLRNMKDEDEDWGRWRDVVFRAKGKLVPGYVPELDQKPPPHRKERGGKKKNKQAPAPPAPDGTSLAKAESTAAAASTSTGHANMPDTAGAHAEAVGAPATVQPTTHLADSHTQEPTPESSEPPLPADQLSTTDVTAINPPLAPGAKVMLDDSLYCAECYLPLHPDPKPEALYIFLHALRYTTSLGTFETEMPEWAAEDFEWDQKAVGSVV
ncbi:pseudouridine synthase [Schizophyllum commune H4-8]|uniref:pseudouridine synthase n=1 Tax=Schizophyllum commune (strain H4-8 / FGSC 9210) TaxID=578458 RepID=UPI0021604183|nr:pseudouridine synthase [Schizophyllum commune H4-8]KAI5889974.1 pseudouridine synthase [Schizophyllum commune H4-8]